MKILIPLLALGFASCQDAVIEAPDPENIYYSFQASCVREPYDGAASYDTAAYDVEGLYTQGDYQWDIYGYLPHSSNPYTTGFYIDPVGGYFDIALQMENFNGTSDSIYGTGFVSADTLWLLYTYRSLWDGDSGVVAIHSL